MLDLKNPTRAHAIGHRVVIPLQCSERRTIELEQQNEPNTGLVDLAMRPLHASHFRFNSTI